MTTKNEMIQVFEEKGFKVRYLLLDGEVKFNLNDVGTELGFVDNKGYIRRGRLFSAMEKSGIVTVFTNTNEIKNIHENLNFSACYISEGEFNELAFESQTQRAKQFRKWVAFEVLPSIRKTGSYSAPTQMPTDMATLMQMTQQNVQMMNATVSVFNQEITRVNSTLNDIKTTVSTWEDKTDNERNNRRISYSQITVDFPEKVKKMVIMTHGDEVGGKTKIYLSAKKYILNTLLDVNRANDITIGQWSIIDELIADNRDDWYATYLRKLEEKRLERLKQKTQMNLNLK